MAWGTVIGAVLGGAASTMGDDQNVRTTRQEVPENFLPFVNSILGAGTQEFLTQPDIPRLFDPIELPGRGGPRPMVNTPGLGPSVANAPFLASAPMGPSYSSIRSPQGFRRPLLVSATVDRPGNNLFPNNNFTQPGDPLPGAEVGFTAGGTGAFTGEPEDVVNPGGGIFNVNLGNDGDFNVLDGENPPDALPWAPSPGGEGSPPAGWNMPNDIINLDMSNMASAGSVSDETGGSGKSRLFDSNGKLTGGESDSLPELSNRRDPHWGPAPAGGAPSMLGQPSPKGGGGIQPTGGASPGLGGGTGGNAVAFQSQGQGQSGRQVPGTQGGFGAPSTMRLVPREAPEQTMGFDQMTGAAQQLMQQGLHQPVRSLGFRQARGDFLSPSTNPALRENIRAAQRPMIEEFQQSIIPSIQSQAESAGAFGGAREGLLNAQAADDLMQNLGEVSSRMVGQNFARERGLQQNAPQLLQQSIGLQTAPGSIMRDVGGARRQILGEVMQEPVQRFQLGRQRFQDRMAQAMFARRGRQQLAEEDQQRFDDIMGMRNQFRDEQLQRFNVMRQLRNEPANNITQFASILQALMPGSTTTQIQNRDEVSDFLSGALGGARIGSEFDDEEDD